jgi:hypothetical protein
MARTLELAEAVGQAWVAKQNHGNMTRTLYIGVSDPVLADESILEKTN